MNVNDLLKRLIEEKGLTRAEVGRRLGMSSGQAFDSRLKLTSVPKVDFVAAVLEQLDYRLVIVPAGTQRLPNGSIVIDNDFEFRPMSNRARGAAVRVANERAAREAE